MSANTREVPDTPLKQSGRPRAGKAARRILFIRTDRLGETLLNLPAVAALKWALPGASITLLVHPEAQPLLVGLPGIDRVLADRHTPEQCWWARAFRLGQVLRSYRFDLAVVSNPKKELHVAVWLARIPWRVGYDRKWGRLLTHRLQDRKALGERHEVEYNLDLVRTLGVPIQAPPWHLPRFSQEQAEVLQLLDQEGIQRSEPFIAMHPWTSNPRKQWPLERFRALIRLVADHRSERVVVIGSSEEQPSAHAVLPEGLPVVNVVGRLDLKQLAALLQCARTLISNDSGPVHLAAAVGTPTVVLFGTTDAAAGPRRWGPWGNNHTIIWKPSMEAISVEEVFTALQRCLQRSA